MINLATHFSLLQSVTYNLLIYHWMWFEYTAALASFAHTLGWKWNTKDDASERDTRGKYGYHVLSFVNSTFVTNATGQHDKKEQVTNLTIKYITLKFFTKKCCTFYHQLYITRSYDQFLK